MVMIFVVVINVIRKLIMMVFMIGISWFLRRLM